MTFKNPLHKLLNKQEKISELSEQFEAAQQLPDAGIRLQRLHEIFKEADTLLGKTMTQSALATIPPTMVGGTVMMAGIVTFNPLLFFSGMLVATSSAGAEKALGKDSLEGLRKIWLQSMEAQQKLVDTVTMDALAKSERFEQVMEQYPTLKRKYLTASQEKMQEQPAQPSKPARTGGFNL